MTERFTLSSAAIAMSISLLLTFDFGSAAQAGGLGSAQQNSRIRVDSIQRVALADEDARREILSPLSGARLLIRDLGGELEGLAIVQLLDSSGISLWGDTTGSILRMSSDGKSFASYDQLGNTRFASIINPSLSTEPVWQGPGFTVLDVVLSHDGLVYGILGEDSVVIVSQDGVEKARYQIGAHWNSYCAIGEQGTLLTVLTEVRPSLQDLHPGPIGTLPPTHLREPSSPASDTMATQQPLRTEPRPNPIHVGQPPERLDLQPTMRAHGARTYDANGTLIEIGRAHV